MAGPSDLPDPAFHAYRRDLADVTLAGRVIASHYVEGVDRRIAGPATLRERPSEEADVAAELDAGDAFRMLEDSVGWSWGYAGAEGRVGYVRSEAVAPA